MDKLALGWFAISYLGFGILLITWGLYLLLRTGDIQSYLVIHSKSPDPPFIFIQFLKFLAAYSFVSIFFSFFPFRWIELLFALWLLLIVFTAGRFLVHWRQTSKELLIRADELPQKIRFAAANMISLGFVMFLLYYQLTV